MAILINGIRTGLESDDQAVIQKACRQLGLSPGEPLAADVVKRSVDARHKGSISFVSSVRVELPPDREAAVPERPGVRRLSFHPLSPQFGAIRPAGRIVVVGFGPAGMLAAHTLARFGYRPLVLERGAAMEQRIQAVEQFWETGVLNPAANVQFGEGGAGTFSDGKLTTRIHDPLCEEVTRLFLRHGAPPETMRKAKPHIGTDRLRGVVCSIREEILSMGGEIQFNTPLSGIRLQNGRAILSAGGQEIPAAAVLLAIGHSARDTFELLLQNGVPLLPKPFSVGVRIEQLQTDIDRGLYGKLAGNPLLPVGEYALSHRENGRGVYTFCMCPGGSVVPAASEPGGVVTNGMSVYARNGRNANAALVVGVSPGDFGSHPLDGVAFQRKIEQAAFALGGGEYAAPAATVESFLSGAPFRLGRITPTYARGIQPADLHALFPPFVGQMLRLGLQKFGRKLPGFAPPDGLLTAPETRTSSPVRIPRGEDGTTRGVLYPCGEGAGYAGGIMSAATDGLRAALAVMQKFAPES